MDLNGDGRRDVLSGSFPGEIYLFRGNAKGGLEEPEALKDRGGKAIKPGNASVAFAADWDGDGKPDLLVGQFGSGKLRFYRNRGTAAAPRFEGFEWVRAGGVEASIPAG